MYIWLTSGFVHDPWTPFILSGLRENGPGRFQPFAPPSKPHQHDPDDPKFIPRRLHILRPTFADLPRPILSFDHSGGRGFLFIGIASEYGSLGSSNFFIYLSLKLVNVLVHCLREIVEGRVHFGKILLALHQLCECEAKNGTAGWCQQTYLEHIMIAPLRCGIR